MCTAIVLILSYFLYNSSDGEASVNVSLPDESMTWVISGMATNPFVGLGVNPVPAKVSTPSS